MSEVEIFTPTGILIGETMRVPLTNSGPDLQLPLVVEDARWYPIDGSQPVHQGDISVDPDDILLIVTSEHELEVHMAWYAVTLEVGPYRVSGSLPTRPGFDPAKAISRPSGVFTSLRDATVELSGSVEGESAQRAYINVNRYAVDRVKSTLMLGYLFPGAELVAAEAVPVA